MNALRFDKLTSRVFLEIFENVLSSVCEPLVVLDSNLKVLRGNLSFYRTFKANPRETEGSIIYDLGNRQWDIPKLRELLEDILPRNCSFHDFLVGDFRKFRQ